MWGWERMLIAEAEPLWGQDLCSQDPGQRPTQDGFGRPAVIEGVGALGDTRRKGALREGAGAGAGGARCHAAPASTGPCRVERPWTVGCGSPQGKGALLRVFSEPQVPPHRGGCAGTAQGTGLPRQESPARLGNAAQRPAREPGRVPRDRTPRDRHGIRSPEPWAPPPTVPDTQFRSRPRGTAGVGSTTPVLPRLCPPLDAGSGALPSHCESGGRSLREL